MYLSGNIGNYTHRIHQLPTGINDIDSFTIEGNSYVPIVSLNLVIKWDRELRKKNFIFTNNPLYLNIPQLNYGSGESLVYILDQNNNLILDEQNNELIEES